MPNVVALLCQVYYLDKCKPMTGEKQALRDLACTFSGHAAADVNHLSVTFNRPPSGSYLSTSVPWWKRIKDKTAGNYTKIGEM